MLPPDLVKVLQTRKQNRLTFGNSGKQVLSCCIPASPTPPVSSVAKEEALGQAKPFLELGAIALAWQTCKGVVCNRGRLDCCKGNITTGRKFFLLRKWRTWLVESSLYKGSREASGSADPVGKISEQGGCRVPGKEPH